MRLTVPRLLLSGMAALLLPLQVWAQFSVADLSPVTRTYAITHARVVQAPGKVLENATLVVRNGLITAVGVGIPIPTDAELIEADSMYVYPGFISGLDQSGVKKPETGREERQKDPDNPALEVAGITPWVRVSDQLNPGDNALDAMRQAGFTAAQLVPYGKMLPGMGAAVVFKGSKAEEMVYREGTALFAQFKTANRVYPSTVIGITAKWRDLYRQAVLAQRQEKNYAANPAGMTRPAFGPEIRAFYPVIDQQMPVYFWAPSLLDAHRALNLRAELGFPIVLSGIQEGHSLADRLKKERTPLLLSLNMPEKPKAADEKKEEVDLAKLTASAKEMYALEARKVAAIDDRYRQAADMHQAGLTFAFATLDCKPKDLHAVLCKVVAAGLPEDAALAALTVNPAQMLGLSRSMGTLETGKMANFFMTDKPYFTEEAKVKFVFVEGEKFSYEAKAKPSKGDADAIVDVVGTWAYTTESPQGTSTGLIKISGQVGNYSGTISTDRLGTEDQIQSINLSGNQLSLSYNLEFGGQNLQLEIDVVVAGDTFEGTINVGQFGAFPIEGQRQPSPQE